MSTPDETASFPGVTDGECSSCKSGSRSEAYYVPGRTGMPVTCTSDWHDEDAQGPGAPGTAALDETRADTGIIAAAEDHDATLTFPAIRAGDPAPATETRAPAIHCPGCGQTFADAGFGGRALFLAETLHTAALDAGWAEDAGKWTCSVCLAGITGPLYGPEREPVPSLPAPDTDPYRQYADMSAELDQDVARFWRNENQEHNAARFRIGTRLHDARILIGEISGVAA